jgi:hypothetical protein
MDKITPTYITAKSGPFRFVSSLATGQANSQRKSEIRSTKSETNSNFQNPNDLNMITILTVGPVTVPAK